jgi:hypothetical protein
VPDSITTSEAAARKGCTTQAVIDAAKRGEINARKFGPVWAVDDDDALAAWTIKETGGRAHRSKRETQRAEQ